MWRALLTPPHQHLPTTTPTLTSPPHHACMWRCRTSPGRPSPAKTVLKPRPRPRRSGRLVLCPWDVLTVPNGGGARDSTRAWAWCCVASLYAVTIRGCRRHDVRFIVLGGEARDQWVVLSGGCDVRHREGCGAQARALFTALAAASALYVLPRHPKTER